MKAYEFPAQIAPDGQLRLPDAALAEINGDQVVRVIVLIQDQAEAWTDRAWSARAAGQFLAGYSAEDAIYDTL